MFGDLESQRTAAWLDPFGLTAFDLQTSYWTIAEKNSRTPALSGELLWNRVVWLSLSVSPSWPWAVGSFRYDHARSTTEAAGAIVEAPAIDRADARWIRERPTFARGTPWAQFASQLRLETRPCRPQPAVRADPGLRPDQRPCEHRLPGSDDGDAGLAGHPPHARSPSARGMSFLLIIIITFFAGEMVWRERSLRLEGVVDALPVPTWVPLAGEALALWAAAAVVHRGRACWR